MRLTWADQLRKEGQEQGVEKGVRQTLLRLLGARFGTLERLNQIADQVLVARSLEEMGLQ